MKPKLYMTSKDGLFEEQFMDSCADFMPAAQQVSVNESEIICSHRGFGVAIQEAPAICCRRWIKKNATLFLRMFAAKNPDGSRVPHATNPTDSPVQVQLLLDGERYYVRLAENSLSSIVY